MKFIYPSYTSRELKIAGVLFVCYVSLYALGKYFLPEDALINPASAVALSALYFGGLRLFPVVYISALVAGALHGTSMSFLFVFPLLETLVATSGAYLLKNASIDPLFRRFRDSFFFVTIILLLSLIKPTLTALFGLFNNAPEAIFVWRYAYMAEVFCLIIIVPFILRWFAKPKFSRNTVEVVETLGAFALLIGINWALFVSGMTSLLYVPLVFLLLIPFFWTALRLRPRFVTLALLITSLFSIHTLFGGAHSDLVLEQLFQTEIFISVLAIAFLIVTSLEEDRRVNTNLMRSQMGTLKNAVARISLESKAKNDFMAVLGHELRNPLAVVVSSIDLMQLKGQQNEEDKQILTVMQGRMGMVNRLLDDLLDISRISEGKINLKKEPLNLESIINRSILSTEHHRVELHQRLIYKKPERRLTVLGDAVRLEQVFSNLLTNASKYSSSGDTIQLNIKERGDLAQIEIIDEGVGLDPHELEIIFQPFHQVEQGERSRKGLGIGLSLVKNFIQMHNGVVEVRSDGHGRGSRFIVSLPVTISPTAPNPARQEKVSAVELKSERTVLVVDDDRDIAESLGRLLEFEGFRVAYAYDGKEAVEKTMLLTPDVVLLDIGLPDQDGFTVAKILRAQGYRGHLVPLTGYESENAKELTKDAGFEYHLLKPVEIDDLRRVFSKLT